MDVRVAQFESEAEPDDYDLPDQHSSDSSFDRRMLQHMTRDRTARRGIHTRRIGDVPLAQFDRKARGAVQATIGGSASESPNSPQSQRQRRRLNRPLEDFDRIGPARKQEQLAMREAEVEAVKAAPHDTESASHKLFQRYARVKNGGTPIVQDSDPNMWNLGPDDVMPTVEDSPLSRKSVGRGTPGTAQSTKSRAFEKVLSWNMSDEFDENSIIASTPAYHGKRMTLEEIKQAEQDASALRNSLLAQSTVSNNQINAHEIDAARGNGRPQTFTRSYKAQLRGIRDAEAHAQRQRFSRPLSRDGMIERDQDSTSGEIEDEVFKTVPDIPIQLTRDSPRRQRQPSISSETKENIPPINHQASIAAFQRESAQDAESGDHSSRSNDVVSQSVAPSPILIYEDPPIIEEHAQTASQRPATDVTSRRRRAQISDKSKTLAQSKPKRSSAPAGDSIDVLRRLSRSVSGTPTPQKPSQKEDDDDNKQALSRIIKTASINLQTGSGAGTVAPPFNQRGTESSVNQNQAVASSEPIKLLPTTPRVTGAWVETPMAASKTHEAKSVTLSPVRDVRRASPKKASKDVLEPRAGLESSAPKLPASALSALVTNAKGKGKRLHSDEELGDSTISSLEGLMGRDLWNVPDSDLTNAPNMISEEDRTAVIELLGEKLANELPYANGQPASVQERRLIRDIIEQRVARGLKHQKHEEAEQTSASSNDNGGEPKSPMTPRRKDRLLEELQLQRMSEHVNSMHSRTRYLSKGLGRIERKLADTATCSYASCDGNCFASHPLSAYTKVLGRSIYRTTDAQTHLTKLGWMLVISLLWMTGELILWFVLT